MELMQLIALGSVLIQALVLAAGFKLLVRHPGDVFAFTFYLSTYFFVCRPLIFIFGLDTPFPDYLFGNYWVQVIQGSVMSTLYFCAMILGAYLARGPMLVLGRAFPAVDILPKPRVALYASLLFSGIALMITLTLLATYGSFGGIMYANKVQKAFAGSHFLKHFGSQAVFFSIITYLLCVHYKRMGVQISSWISPLALAGVVIGILSTYAWGTRWDTALGLFALAIGWMCYRGRFSYSRLFSFAFVLTLFLVGLRFMRDIATAGRIHTLDNTGGDFFRTIAISTHGTYFDAFMLLIRDVGYTIPLRWGQDFYYGLLGVVPRALWSGKPPGNEIFPGAWFRKVYQPEMINGWPFTTPGEWYVNFGFLGMLLGGFLGGILYRTLQTRSGDVQANPIVLVFSIIYSGLMFHHGINVTWAITYVYWVPAMFIYLFVLRLFGSVQFPPTVTAASPVRAPNQSFAGSA
jgi:oligosaccharide repeat unit polymerase